AHGGELSDYYGESLVPGPTLPVVAIPTTAGTGSEVTPVAVFGDERRKLKAGVSSTYLLPAWAIDDPQLTLTCPPSVTAHSGLDALSHAIESLCTASYDTFAEDLELGRIFSGKNAYSDALAMKAVGLIATSLRNAVSNGHDLVAREQMMLASLLAGMAFGAAGTGVTHALQYPIGAMTKTPHGLGIALMLPAVMRFNAAVRVQELAQIARLLEPALDLDDAAAALEAADAVARLGTDVGVGVGLASIGITSADIAGIARDAIGIERLIRLNPRPLTVADLELILASAL
ncbi:MAG: iron-containing alcohol dehydrogenase, partial [Actinomycetes bacterium]